MDLQDLNKEKNISQKLRTENKACDIFKAQEKNKRNICRRSNEKLWEKHILEKENKNSENRNELIRKYVHLVNWIVSRLPVTSLKGMDRDDLIGYGTIGLIEAVDRFDPGRNSSFESFAVTRIRGSIYDHLRASDWLTRGSRKRVKNLTKVISELENRLHRYPTDTEIAKELSITLDELRVIQQEAQIGIYSLDEPKDNYSGEDTTIGESISSNSQHLLDKMEENELKELLAKAIDALPERERTVIGLYHYKKLTFKEIAEVMSFSESRASQIHARAILLLKSKMLKD